MRWLPLVLVMLGCGRIGFDSAGTTGPCNVAACAGAGGACHEDECVIEVNGGGKVTCPPGLDCTIECNAISSCQSGVDCSMANSCTVHCVGAMTCSNATIDCRGGGCVTSCLGDGSCNGPTFVCGGMPCEVNCCGSNMVCNGISGASIQLPPTCP